MNLVVLLLSAGVAGAQSPPGALNMPSGACNLQVQDVGRRLQGAPVIVVRDGDADVSCELRDDGMPPGDMTAGDFVWGCLVNLTGAGPWSMDLRTPTGAWSGALPAGQTTGAGAVFLTLTGSTIALRTDIVMSGTPGAVPSAPSGPASGQAGQAGPPSGNAAASTMGTPASAPAAGSGGDTSVTAGFLKLSTGAWTALVMLAAAVLGPAWVARRGRAGVPVGLPAAHDVYAPRSVTPELVDVLVSRLVARHRVVVLGAKRAGLLDPRLVHLSDASTPAELVAVVEWLAAAPGDPLALVVDTASLLERDRADRWGDLAERVQGRFPTYGVGAPWSRWVESG